MVGTLKLHEGNFALALALIRNIESYFELNTKEQIILHLAETPLFSPEICTEVVCAGILNALNNKIKTSFRYNCGNIRAICFIISQFLILVNTFKTKLIDYLI